jgi:hypothetical protein
MTPEWRPEYTVTIDAYFWFWLLCLVLWRACVGRPKSSRARLA